VGSNAYVWLSLIMLVALPLAASSAPASVPRAGQPVKSAPDLAELDRELATVSTARVPAQEERRLVGA
jgi:hypothetical protein